MEQQRDAVSIGRVLETVVMRQTVVYKAKENTDGCIPLREYHSTVWTRSSS